MTFVSEPVGGPADLRGLRASLGRWLEQNEISGLPAIDAILVAHEAAKNALEAAAGSCSVEVRATLLEHQLLLTVTGARPPRLRDGAPTVGGLRLVQALSREVELVRHSYGTTMRMRIPLE